ncbi:alanine racemase [Corynebacterium tapiri]|uniref:Alanine racemase n=1 Tax=Corynebacterium tapiri TaxID=1448266 RepID=A0A5C4U497_9CORY|nr:alanine racemase [Corynebacterium tapiri]TNL98509.1 alanine racemase [Corynebacterium tapiri]
MNQLRTVIDLEAIQHNIEQIRGTLSPGVRLMAVLKADAYNHGAVQVARSVRGIDAIGVATLDEAIELRLAGVDKPILAWLWTPHGPVEEALAAGIELAVPSLQHLKYLVEAQIPAKICFKVETGMHRSGIEERLWERAFELARQAQHLSVTGVMSHCACADEPTHPANGEQKAAFERAISVGREMGFALPCNHLANSAATLVNPDLHYDQVRVGLALYGLDPLPGDWNLHPAMSWQADVISVKPVAPGDSVSYGYTHTFDRHGFVGLIPAGYADGVPRAAQGKLEVTIGGRRYQQVGRVCMDQIVVDLGDNPQAVAPGDTAIIMGAGGMGAEDLADRLGTISYEVACLPKGRTVREYRES